MVGNDRRSSARNGVVFRSDAFSRIDLRLAEKCIAISQANDLGCVLIPAFGVRGCLCWIMQIRELLEQRLKPCTEIPDSEWQVWEHKTLNMHRAVLEWTPHRALRNYGEVSGSIRAEVARRFKVSWWRGMGFGAVVYLPFPPDEMATCVDDIDVRQNSKGTWQWSIFVLKESRAVLGVHMWMSGYLSSVYELVLSQCETEGYQVATFKKDKDKLMQFLTSIHRFPEYEDPRSKSLPDS